jgi:hypothetical protein
LFLKLVANSNYLPRVISSLICILLSYNYLMPWPGPHKTLEMVSWLLPAPMDMQSSPVPMEDLEILIPVESAIWMPSVFGLSLGADIFR